MSQSTDRGLPTANIPNQPDATHREGVANQAWPLCLESEAISRGWSSDEIARGYVADDDPFELSGQGFWRVTCTECEELMHA